MPYCSSASTTPTKSVSPTPRAKVPPRPTFKRQMYATFPKDFHGMCARWRRSRRQRQWGSDIRTATRDLAVIARRRRGGSSADIPRADTVEDARGHVRRVYRSIRARHDRRAAARRAPMVSPVSDRLDCRDARRPAGRSRNHSASPPTEITVPHTEWLRPLGIHSPAPSRFRSEPDGKRSAAGMGTGGGALDRG